FPNGHLSVPIGGGFQGRAWFPLRVSELEAAIAAGEGVDLRKAAPPGLDQALAHGRKFLAALGVPLERVVLGGFSQGGMLATELALRAETGPAGLVILSGSLVDAENWARLAPNRKGLRFFQSHGTEDPVLRIEPARALERLLTEAGLDGMLYEFRGQHEIPMEVLRQLGSYLRGVLPR
ncbi:MAG: serine esterase, partial [Bdellovibrionaceae bacterium]|nr:serine esterase [Pseudobdellovibrionaceae bacterium]